MNDNDLDIITGGPVGSITISNSGDYGIVNSSGTISPITVSTTASTIGITGFFDMDDFLDEHIMSRITVDHKVAGHELLKLKEHAPDYANEIKENLTKNVARDIIKKVTFTKKDGTERNMLCTLNPDLLPAQVDLEESVQKKTPNPDVLAVYDVEKDGWRSFRYDSIIGFSDQ